MADMLVINDGNASRFIDEHDDRTQGVAGIRSRDVPMGGLACAAPLIESIPLIPKSEWKDRVRHMKAAGGFPNDKRRALSKHLGRSVVKDQNGLNYCHLFALANCVESVLDFEGLSYTELAPESLGGVVGWSNAGGYMTRDLEWAADHGISPRDFCPTHVINPRSFKTGWQDAAKQYTPLEWFELGHSGDLWAECVTALLSGFPVYPGFAWWSHSVMLGGLTEDIDGEIENSWGPSWSDGGYAVLSGSKKVPSIDFGCFALRVTTWPGKAVA